MVKIINNFDLTKGIYIPSIECNWLYKAHMDNKDHNYIVDEKYLDKLLNGKIDWSYELMENDILTDNINIVEVKNNKGEVIKIYTLDIVNVKYTKRYKTKEEQQTTKRLRDWSYEHGFVFNGNKMTNWKRSGGKARVGENLFLLDSICSKCLDWSRMDLKFTDKQSIASVRAYESLPLSSAFTSIDIPEPHKSILVIADYKSKFTLNMSQTWLENKELHTESKLTEESNSIWDGQGTLSKKIFDSNELTIGHGNMLLRNRLTKINGISCDIELYYRDYCGSHKEFDYDTLTVTDIAGRTLFAKDILLITTPSALKIEKFNKQVLDKEEYKKHGKYAWLYYYLDNCGMKYAVCKVDKPSHYENNRNVLSYQMINTIPFNKEQLSELVAPEIVYVEKLKDDLNFFLQEVNKNKDNAEDMANEEKELSYINNNNNYVKISNNIDVTGAFTIMSKYNPDFAKTSVFKEFRRSFIKAYVEELRQGKIRVSGDYCIANGNVVEMLKATTGEFNGKTITLKCNQIFCSRFENHELVVGFRNPHINISNIGTHIVTNDVPEIRRYFACTKNQVFFNSIDYPTLSLYQGMDFDIDSVLFTNEKCVVDACLNVDKNITAISVNKIKESKGNKQLLIAQNMSDIDHKISKNYIGDVINLSCELNSKLNHYKYNNIHTDKLDLLFDLSSRCSSISCCEIDKAKKAFEDLNISYEINKIKHTTYKDGEKEVGLFDLVDSTVVDLFKDILKDKDDLETLKKDINAERTELRKPILKQIRDIRKELQLGKDGINEDILKLQLEIEVINKTREAEIIELKSKKINKQIDLGKLDTRRIKPFFFKFIGDNKVKKQRSIVNRKHREEIDLPIVIEYCKLNNIEIIIDVKDNCKIVYDISKIKELKKNKNDLKELLKVNDKIQEEWVNKIYDKAIDTPMNWLELELDTIKDADTISTIQVIQLLKKSHKKANEDKVNKVIEIIKGLNSKIKEYKNNDDLVSVEKVKKIRQAKSEACKKIKEMKLNKVNLSRILIEGLNSIKKNKKIERKTSIESILLEILFQIYGIGLLSLFKNGGDSKDKK